MSKVSVRELRNQGGKVLDRLRRGEQITITRDGEDVAELTAMRGSLSADALVSRRRDFPAVDPDRLRRDLDRVIDAEM